MFEQSEFRERLKSREALGTRRAMPCGAFFFLLVSLSHDKEMNPTRGRGNPH